MKRLGIILRQVDVDQRALTQTGKTHVKQLTDAERATATLALITDKAGVAIGDLDRTQESAANQARRLRAELVTMNVPNDFTQLLVAWGGGEEGALERLIPLVYQELRKTARRQLRGERLRGWSLLHRRHHLYRGVVWWCGAQPM